MIFLRENLDGPIHKFSRKINCKLGNFKILKAKAAKQLYLQEQILAHYLSKVDHWNYSYLASAEKFVVYSCLGHSIAWALSASKFQKFKPNFETIFFISRGGRAV
jgi:hypothetical protein